MRSLDFEEPDMERVDLHNRIWREQRLPIHVTRTEADLWSHAEPAKKVVYRREARRKVA